MNTPRVLEHIRAHHPDAVMAALHNVQDHVAAGGTALGYVAYEASPAFEPPMRTHPANADLPLLDFALLEGAPEACRITEGALVLRDGLVSRVHPAQFNRGDESGAYEIGPFTAGMAEPAYVSVVDQIRAHIAAGDTYQVNYTFPLRARFTGDAYAWFLDLCAAQGRGPFMYFDLGRYKTLCASPELFFHRQADSLRMKPMKGTRRRGRWLGEDQMLAEALRASAKDQAENLMIVDMLRNDLGRIARSGSVQVPQLFDAERYQTVWQMTSTVTAKTDAAVPEIFAAAFPCGSVTGAPKIETMRIIAALEPQPRGVYCGAVGWWQGEEALFNVGIRTAVVDTHRQEAVYHVGSGIAWDSDPAEEYRECLAKAAVLQRRPPPFALLETLLLADGAYFLMDAHLRRMGESADYFGFVCDRAAITKALQDTAREHSTGKWRVRLQLAPDGAARAEAHALTPLAEPLRVVVARDAVDAQEVFLFHKTTHRRVYEAARSAYPAYDEVILCNRAGEITEGTIANVVLEMDGVRYTPPVPCGLLNGTFRQHLLDTGEIHERVLYPDDLKRGKLWLINSVRRWIQAEVDPYNG